MTSEPHELLIDQLFKRVNLGRAVVERVIVERASSSRPGERRSRKTSEHADPFAHEEPSGGKPVEVEGNRAQGLEGAPPINSSS
ncbi:MAG: hypothetical protein HQL99_07005 [Magnetococcales bacterium]|nr:hypothetical protein [Magnetococcales bacterium]